jgi:alanyl-tRNA synthetase
MTAKEIRQAYIKFFVEKGHKVVERASLVPQGDPTTLFTGSGMQPMVPYLLGETYPGGIKRIADSQVVFRAVDIDEVGDSEHLTSFEMLGNWSLGDYFKKEQIPWIAEFLFDVIKLEAEKVYITCYIGNSDLGIPEDNEAIELWRAEFEKRGIEAKVVELGSAENGDKLGMQGGRIFLYDGKENWWSRGGDENGTPLGDPCGPDSEMFFDFGEQYHDEAKWGKAHPASDSPRFTEIGNNVFMGYKKESEKDFVKLKAPNIDHGAGLERLAMASLGVPDISKVDLISDIIENIEKISGKNSNDYPKAFRVIADHLKSAFWLGVDGVRPSNTAQGYVMRRLIRRATRFGLSLGITENLSQPVAGVIRDIYAEDYPEVEKEFEAVAQSLLAEEIAFRRTLHKGLKELEKMVGNRHPELDSGSNQKDDSEGIQDKSSLSNWKGAEDEAKQLSGHDIFKLKDTYGFPMELTLEEAAVLEITLAPNWREQFDGELEAQRQRSRTATKGQFKGGLGGQTEIHTKYHTATHLMYKALRMVLGEHVEQKGSNITEERLRFDFNNPEKMTPEQISEVENIVNKVIADDVPVTWEEMPTEEALASGARGHFGEKYGATSKVYIMGHKDAPFSLELCGGPHVTRTGALGEGNKTFKILKEQSSSAGIRRIKAVLQ